MAECFKVLRTACSARPSTVSPRGAFFLAVGPTATWLSAQIGLPAQTCTVRVVSPDMHGAGCPFRRDSLHHDRQDILMDTLGIEPRASRMLSGCDTTTPCALELTTVKERCRKKRTGGTCRYKKRRLDVCFCPGNESITQVWSSGYDVSLTP